MGNELAGPGYSKQRGQGARLSKGREGAAGSGYAVSEVVINVGFAESPGFLFLDDVAKTLGAEGCSQETWRGKNRRNWENS
jgi:hypothetical protein